MVKMSEETIRKRLQTVNQTQEAVQTCSKWVLHNREMIDRIATCWTDIYKKAPDKLRIALIYLLNDVVQKAANKRDTNVTSAFHPHWINATGISNVSVKKAISRCVEVLEQRNVYAPHIIEEMKAALVSRIATEKDDSQSGEIDFAQMARGIDSFFKNEVLTEKAREILARSSFNFKESIQSRVKDREEGVKALTDMDTSRQKMASFLESVERHRQKGMKLMELMQHAKQTFNLQLRDVTVVNDAYEKFAEGMRETKQQLEKLEKSGALAGLGASPPRDAPSPTAGDDPFIHGVDGDEATGAEDMEMDEEDAPGPSSCFLKPSKDYVASIPTVPEMDPRLQRLVNQNASANQLSESGIIPMPAASLTRTALDPRQLDPRQARFFPPPQQPPPQLTQHLNFPPPAIPPPGLSPPPTTQKTTQDNADPRLTIDKSQPPPKIFSLPPPQISNGATVLHDNPSNSHGGSTALPPSIALFNPSNPPPSLLGPQMQISPPSHNQMNFPLPHPSSTIVQPPLPLVHFQTLPFYHGGQKRRNSSGSAVGNYKQRRAAWSFSGGENNERVTDTNWRIVDESGDGGHYRH